MKIKVLIVDDHPVFLAGLKALIENDKEIKILGQGRDGKEAIKLEQQLNPDVIIMDINMPGKNGIEATKEILKNNPSAKLLGLSIHSGKRFVKGMLEAGAKGYLLKDAVPEELILAIKKVSRGDMYLSSSITSVALENDSLFDKKPNGLSTKLHRPPITKEHVFRPGLINSLSKNQYKPFTLVSAGAGYGKSMLVSSWLEKIEMPYVWISLSEEDNDFRDFITGVTKAVRKKFPNTLTELNNLVDAITLPQLNLIVENLINGLDEIEEEFVIVLDDYHLIENTEINGLISRLLHFPPQLMHLVMLTRRDPYLDLGYLRSHSRIHEIRMADLCFNENEMEVLFKNLFNLKISEKNIEKLHKQTEGWVTGLRLASLTVKSNEDPNEAFEKINTINLAKSNFLLKEAISNLPETIQKCLIKVSILDRFCDEIIEEAFLLKSTENTKNITGKEVIQTLVDYNLFTISLDYDRKWYRFHHLFQELLQNQLKEDFSEEIINGYHQNISKWLYKNNFIEEAVQHALKGSEVDLAVFMVINYRYELINTEQMHRLNRLLNLLPNDSVETIPELLSARAFYLDFIGERADLFRVKDKALEIINKSSKDPQEFKAVIGELETLDGIIQLIYGDWNKLIACSKKALSLLPTDAIRLRLNALGYQVVGFLMEYDIEVDNVKINNLLTKYPLHSNYAKVSEQLWYSLVHAMLGNTTELKISSKKMIDFGEENHWNETLVYGSYFLSHSYFLANELDKAEIILQKTLKGSYAIRINYIVQCAYMMASIHIDRGEVEKSNKLIDMVLRKAEEVGSETLSTILQAMRVELALKENNINKAIELFKYQDFNAIYPPIWFVYVPQLTPIKLKIALNTPEGIKEAQQMLSVIESELRKTNKKSILIDVLILQATVFKRFKNIKEATAKLTEAIELSSAGNIIRSYVDNGASLQSLIASMLKKSEHKEHISKILKEIIKREASQNEQVNIEISRNSEEQVKLSFRELEVLRLVAKGLRNKEISEKLFVQTDTIKKHMKNISAKLQVSNRVLAVKKAEELNLLTID